MQEGKFCTVQGAVSQVGDLGAAIWSIAIAYHTFWLIFLLKKPHRLAVPLVMISGWSLLIILPIVGPTLIQDSKRGSFYGLTGAWCWVGTGYGAERLVYLYGWIFGALGSSFIIYTLIYLRFSNIIILGPDGKTKYNFRPNIHRQPFPRAKATHSHSTISEQPTPIDPIGYIVPSANTHLRGIARRIMWYPILYAVVVLPVSVCRMGVLAGWEPPFGLFVFAGICFGSSGITNTILFVTTRKNFIVQTAKGPAARIHVTTHQVTIRDDLSFNGREIELNSMKLDNSPSSPRNIKDPMDFYGGHSARNEDSGVGKILVIGDDSNIEHGYTLSR
ncbi:hypothetical protein K439DRAFT_1658006 [Ramaria rubella]|nr:hypothetical protein K439DRAFT_1658006 [Ramaria rubella]